MGGRQAGCIGLLSLLASGCNVLAVVAYDDFVKALAEELKFLSFFKNDSASFG